MKKTIILAACLLYSIQFTYAQGGITVLRGTPVLADVTNNVEGTPYLSRDFSLGSILLINGVTKLDNLKLKFNAFKDFVSYKDNEGNEMLIANSVKWFTIENEGRMLTFQKGFPTIEKYDENTYYEVLNKKGGPMILKKHIKTLLSRKEYNSSKVTDTYLDERKYFVLSETAGMSKFKTDKKSLATYFPGKEKEMNEYIAKNKINFKDDQDLEKLFDFYIAIK
ncbi:MAG: hypothetical protein V4541_04410 [Bacteroidota bacterium]